MPVDFLFEYLDMKRSSCMRNLLHATKREFINGMDLGADSAYGDNQIITAVNINSKIESSKS